jgi:AcrR family transcriptional regulator
MMPTMNNNITVTRKQQIALTAMQIISEEGLNNFAMIKIANRIGVTDSALYKHFKTKNEMLGFMVEMIEQSIKNSVFKKIVDIQDPIEKLYAIMNLQFKFLEENKGIPRILFSESLQQEHKVLKVKIAKIIFNFREVIKNIITSAKKDGIITEKIDAEAAAGIFIGMIQSTIIFWTLSDFSYSLKDKQKSLWHEYRKIIR